MTAKNKPYRLSLLLASALSLGLSPMVSAQILDVEVVELEMDSRVPAPDTQPTEQIRLIVPNAMEEAADTINLPAQAISGDTMFVAYVDFEQVRTPEVMASAKALLDVMPPMLNAMTGELRPQLEAQAPMMDMVLREVQRNGGLGLVLGVNAPQPEGADDEPEAKSFALIKLAEGNDGAALMQMIKERVEPGDEDAMTVEKFAPGWLVMTRNDLIRPEGGNQELAEFFGQTVGAAGDAPVKFAFRVTDTFRDQVQKAMDEPIADPDAAQFKAKAMPAIEAMQELQFGNGTVTFGATPAATTRLHFPEAATAQKFIASYRATLTDAEAKAKQMLADAQAQGAMMMPIAPEQLEGVFQVLHLEQEGNTVVHTLDKDKVGKLAEAMMPFMMMMMMMG